MARYTGPKTKICRIFGEPILGNGKYLGKNSNPPGQHGATRKRKQLGEYALQLREKQKAKYTYGVLERRFRNTFEEATRLKGVTGENLIRLLEARLDNTVYSPLLKMAKEIPTKLLDTSCLLILELHTMEYISRSTELVGTSIVPLFAESLDASGTLSAAINYGAFQLPLFLYALDKDETEAF